MQVHMCAGGGPRTTWTIILRNASEGVFQSAREITGELGMDLIKIHYTRYDSEENGFLNILKSDPCAYETSTLPAKPSPGPLTHSLLPTSLTSFLCVALAVPKLTL